MNTIPTSRSLHVILRLALTLTLTLVIFAAAIPQSAQAAVKCVAYHTVQEGQNKVYVAQTYGMKWINIAKANNLQYPYILKTGQRLCIPSEDSTFPDKKSTKGTMKASVVNKLVKVTASGFPGKNVFYVKVRDASSYVGGWHKLGRLRVAKRDSSTGLYILPSELRSAIFVEVCLKNATTDELKCQTVLRRFT